MSYSNIPSTIDNVHVDALRMRAPKIFSDAAKETGRKLAIVGLLEKYGNLMFNADVSWANKWNIAYGLPEAAALTPTSEFNFPNTPRWDQATIDLRAWYIDQSIHYFDWVKNGAGKNAEGTISLLSDRSEALVEGARHQFNLGFTVDGEASGYTNLPHGLESLFGAGTVAAGDKVVQPSDTYAGLSTALGAKPGSTRWTTAMVTKPNSTIATDWPYGNGPVSYDYNSPLMVNISSTAWAGGTTLLDNGEEILRYMCDAQAHRTGMQTEYGGAPLYCLFGSNALRDIKQHFADKQIILQEYQEARDFGLANTVNFEGKMLTNDFHIGADIGYCINPKAVEYFTHFSDLWDVEGPTWKFEMQRFLFLLRSMGNFRLRPRHLGKWYAAA